MHHPNNRLICFVIDSLKNAIVNIKLELELDHDFSVMVYEAHVGSVDALRKREPEQAREDMRRHIEEVDRADETLLRRCDPSF